MESLFLERGVELRLSDPDLTLLGRKVKRDVHSRVAAGAELIRGPLDIVVVHRDAEKESFDFRRDQVLREATKAAAADAVLPVVPVRMTEAWLLLDEVAIRRVAGNPRGRMPLDLPKAVKAESLPDPKAVLRDCLLTASDQTGRRREQVARRFDEHRRQLLDGLDITGPVTNLPSWKCLVRDVEQVSENWLGSR